MTPARPSSPQRGSFPSAQLQLLRLIRIFGSLRNGGEGATVVLASGGGGDAKIPVPVAQMCRATGVRAVHRLHPGHRKPTCSLSAAGEPRHLVSSSSLRRCPSRSSQTPRIPWHQEDAAMLTRPTPRFEHTYFDLISKAGG